MQSARTDRSKPREPVVVQGQRRIVRVNSLGVAKRPEAPMALQRPHFAQQVDVGKLESRLLGERLRSLPIGTRVIAAGDAWTAARGVTKREVWMRVTHPTEVAGARNRLRASHTDTNQRTSPELGTNAAEKPLMGDLVHGLHQRRGCSSG